jgi:transcriptional regulator GlxA family with amidase domain
LGARGAWTGDGSFAAKDAWPVLYGKGQSPVSAPRTLRAAVTKGQHSAAELVDRYRLRNVGVRNLLVDCVNHRFREQTGATALHCAARVRQAQYLLEAITHSVDRVAMQVAQVGFGSATAFRDHFKQIVGTSPQAFRIA